MNTWQLHEAKNKFSALIDRALQGRPQLVTRRGEDAVVVIAAEEYYRRVAPTKSFKDFLSSLPFSDLDLERVQGDYREVGLE